LTKLQKKDFKGNLHFSRWSVIEDALSFPIMTSHDLETCMKKYNGSNWDFRGLHQYFDEVDDEEELDMFFQRLFPVRAQNTMIIQFPNTHLPEILL
jgi:hypothetical protein